MHEDADVDVIRIKTKSANRNKSNNSPDHKQRSICLIFERACWWMTMDSRNWSRSRLRHSHRGRQDEGEVVVRGDEVIEVCFPVHTFTSCGPSIWLTMSRSWSTQEPLTE